MSTIHRILLLIFIISAELLSAQTSLTLTSKNKKYKIKTGEECYITTIPLSNDTSKNYYTVRIGYVMSFKDSVLTLRSTGLNTIYTTKTGIEKLDRVGLDNVTIDLHIAQIEELENFRKWFMAPAVTGWLALISTAIVSPLVSMNFKTHHFDTNKFIKIGGLSLGTAAMSLTFAYTLGRHSAFMNNGQKKHKRLWVIQG